MTIQEFDISATWKTARLRKTPSKPLLWLIEHGYLNYHDSILDWGCGRGRDVDFLVNNLGWYARGWDPNLPLDRDWNDLGIPTGVDVSSRYKVTEAWDGAVTCTYVLNVLPPDLAKEVLEEILGLRSLYRAFFAVRRDLAGSGCTGSGSYQSPHLWLDDRSDLEQIHACQSFAIYASLERGV